MTYTLPLPPPGAAVTGIFVMGFVVFAAGVVVVAGADADVAGLSGGVAL
ncbi:MAG: hypothetical protein ABI656_08305 [bacterium]